MQQLPEIQRVKVSFLTSDLLFLKAGFVNILTLMVLLVANPGFLSGHPVGTRISIATRIQRLEAQQVLEAEQRLSDLGYWCGVIDGTFDSASRHALIAFQKIEGRPRTGKLTKKELQALRDATRPLPRFTEFAHVEIDLTRQVLFVVDQSGLVTHILPVSTGNGGLYFDHGEVHRASTPTGSFKVLRKIRGWRVSSLGLLYYPNYIVNGIAIHGSPSVPPGPASHGCIRVPMFAAKELSALLPVGTDVSLYR